MTPGSSSRRPTTTSSTATTSASTRAGSRWTAATGNRIEANNASEGGVGIAVGDGPVRNEFVLNVANFNEAGGISIETFAAPGSGNLLDRNAAHANTGDGI